jgi:hypothetical protein
VPFWESKGVWINIKEQEFSQQSVLPRKLKDNAQIVFLMDLVEGLTC